MLSRKIKIDKVVRLCGLAIAIWGLGSLSAIAENQNTTEVNSSTNKTNHGLPNYREAGGSRGTCIASGDNLIALIPENPTNNVNVTASISPKLFFYVPETTEQKTIEFVLRDQNDQLVHEVFLQTTGQEGIMNIEIPQDISKSLDQSDSSYHWYLSMICDEQKRARDLVLEGWIGYVELDNSVKQKLENSSPTEQASFYQQEGIWYDALSVVAEDTNQILDPSVTEKWTEMLDSIGLSELSAQPFIDGEIIEE
ncbi:MAG: DUF928 domain-containing protein [Cyanobacteria bacterium P01_F01_bin.143]